jgi:hypothetical protein
MLPAADGARRFGFPASLTWFLRLALAFFLALVIASVASATFGERPPSRLITLVEVLVFGGAAGLCWNILRHSRDQIAANDDGIWRLPHNGAPLFIAWRDVATVRADDVRQRLVVSDRGRTRTILLDYQLQNFPALRDDVLRHTSQATRATPAADRVFHRTWINKVIVTAIAAPWLCLAGVAWAQVGWRAAALLLPIFLLFLSPIAWDPLSVEIARDRVVVRYLGWRREVAFADIASVTLADKSYQGNVWAAVVIARRNRRPIKLYRFREGSLALMEALRGALEDANKAFGVAK